MSGTMSIKERIKAGFDILYHRESGVMDPMEVRKMEAVMYAMANKFVSKEDLEEIKEAVRMTELGRMLREDGRTEGRTEGRTVGRAEAVVDVLQARGIDTRKVEKSILAQTDINVLKRWLMLAAKVESIENFISQM